MKIAPLALLLLALVPVPGRATTTLISDSFTDANGSLNTDTPDTTTNGASWYTSSSAVTVASNAINATFQFSSTSYLDLGASYFSSHPGIYTLSMDTTVGTGTLGGWIGLGFTSSEVVPASNSFATSTSAAAGAGNPFILLRDTGAATVYAGPGTTTPLLTDAAGTFPTATLYNVKLVLNTSSANWTLNAYVGATQLDLNGAAAGDTYTWASGSPIGAEYVGFSTSGTASDTTAATLDNFLLTYDAVPEPSPLPLACMALTLAAIPLARRLAAHRA